MNLNRTISLPLMILCASILAGAQSTDATLSGVVVDTAGKVITNAGIEILNEATGVHYSAETNRSPKKTDSLLHGSSGATSRPSVIRPPPVRLQMRPC